MLSQQEQNNFLASLLPDDPEPGKIVTFPEGQTAGGSTVLSVYDHQDTLIGAASEITPVPNVSGMYMLSRLSSCRALNEKYPIRVITRQFHYNSVIFIQYFGWIGYSFNDKSLTLFDKKYKILALTKTGPEEPSDFFLYEKVCLTNMEETHK